MIPYTTGWVYLSQMDTQYTELIIIDIKSALHYIPPGVEGGLFWLIERKSGGCRCLRWL
jgi:hypothetical protein